MARIKPKNEGNGIQYWMQYEDAPSVAPNADYRNKYLEESRLHDDTFNGVIDANELNRVDPSFKFDEIGQAYYNPMAYRETLRAHDFLNRSQGNLADVGIFGMDIETVELNGSQVPVSIGLQNRSITSGTPFASIGGTDSVKRYIIHDSSAISKYRGIVNGGMAVNKAESAYLRTIWGLSKRGVAQEFNFENMIDSAGKLKKDAMDILNEGLAVWDSVGAGASYRTLADFQSAFLADVSKSAGRQYGSYVFTGHNIFNFDRTEMMKAFGVGAPDVAKLLGASMYSDSLAMLQNLNNPQSFINFLNNGIPVGSPNLTLESVRNILEKNGLNANMQHTVETDVMVEGNLQKKLWEYLYGDPVKRPVSDLVRPYTLGSRGNALFATQSIKTLPVMDPKSQALNASPFDGVYNFANGRLEAAHRMNYPVSRGGIYVPVAFGKGKDAPLIKEYTVGGQTFYGRMFWDRDMDQYSFVSRGTREEAENLLSANFRSYGLFDNGVLKAHQGPGTNGALIGVFDETRAATLIDKAREAYEGMFINRQSYTAYRQFNKYVNAMSSLSADDITSIKAAMAGRSGAFDIAEGRFGILSGLKTKGLADMSIAQLRNMAFMFDRLEDELPALKILQQNLERMNADEIMKGEVLARMYSDIQAAPTTGRMTGSANIFTRNRPGVFLLDEGGVSPRYRPAFLTTREELGSTIRSMLKDIKSAPSQKTVLANMLGDLNKRGLLGNDVFREISRSVLENPNINAIPGFMVNSVTDAIWSEYSSNYSRWYGQSALEMSAAESNLGKLSGISINAQTTSLARGLWNPSFVNNNFATAVQEVSRLQGSRLRKGESVLARSTGSPIEQAMLKDQNAIITKYGLFGDHFTQDVLSKNRVSSLVTDIVSEYYKKGNQNDIISMILDDKHNTIKLVAYSRDMSQQVLNMTKSEILSHNQILKIDIPLLDERGNFYFGNAYKNNPIMIQRKLANRSGSWAESSAATMETIRRNGFAPHIIARDFQVTDVRDQLLQSIKRNISTIAFEKNRMGVGYAQDHLKRIMNSQVIDLMSTDFLSYQSEMTTRAREYLMANQGRIDYDSVVRTILGQEKLGFRSQMQERLSQREAEKVVGAMLKPGRGKFTWDLKAEQIMKYQGLANSLSGYVTFGALGAPGREEIYQSFNLLPLQNVKAVREALQDPSRRGMFGNSLMTQSRYDYITNPLYSNYLGEVRSIQGKTLVVSDKLLAEWANRAGIKGLLPSVNEGGILMSKDVMGYFESTMPKNMKFEKGFKFTSTMTKMMADLDRFKEAHPTLSGTSLERAIIDSNKFRIKGQLSTGKNNLSLGWDPITGDRRVYDVMHDRVLIGWAQDADGQMHLEFKEFINPEASTIKVMSGTWKSTSNTIWDRNNSDDMVYKILRAGGLTDAQIKTISFVKSSKVLKKSDWNVITSEISTDIFNEAMANGVSKDRVLSSMNRAFKNNLFDSSKGTWSDIFTNIVEDPDIKALVGSGGPMTLIMSSMEDSKLINGVKLGPKELNAFYREAMEGMGLTAGAAPLRQDGELWYAMVTSHIQQANVESWQRPFSGTLNGPRSGVGFGIKEMQALADNRIMVNGQEYGPATTLMKWFKTQIDPNASGFESGIGKAEFARAAQDLNYRRMFLEHFTGHDISTPGAVDRWFGGTPSIKTANWDEIALLGDRLNDTGKMSLMGTLFDTGKDGMLLNLPEEVMVTSKHLQGPMKSVYIAPDIDVKKQMEQFLHNPAYAGDSYAYSPYLKNYSRINDEIRLYKEAMATGDADMIAEARTRYHRNMPGVLSDLALRSYTDVLGSTGTAARKVLGTRLGYSAQFKASGLNLFEDTATAGTVFVSQEWAESMLQDMSKGARDDILNIMSDAKGEGALMLGRRDPVISPNSQYMMFAKIDPTLKGMGENAVRLNAGDIIGRFRGDFDGDIFYGIFPFMNQSRIAKGGEYSKLMSSAQQFWQDNHLKTTAQIDEALGQLDDLSRGFTEMYMLGVTERSKSRVVAYQLQQDFKDFMGYKDGNAFTIDSATNEFIAREAKIYKNIGGFSNINTKLKRAFGSMNRAFSSPQFETLMTDVTATQSMMQQIMSAQEFIVQGAEAAEQSSTSALWKRLGEQLKSVGGAVDPESASVLFGQMDEFQRAFTNGEFGRALEIGQALSKGEHAASMKNTFEGGTMSHFGKASSMYDTASETGLKQAIERIAAESDNIGSIMTRSAKSMMAIQDMLGADVFKSVGINAFIANPEKFDNLDQALGFANEFFHPANGTSRFMSNELLELGRATNWSDVLEFAQRGDETMASEFSQTLHGWDSLRDRTRSTVNDFFGEDLGSAARKAAGGVHFDVGARGTGIAFGVGAFMATWLASGLLRGKPDVQLSNADDAPMPQDGRYIDPSLLPPGPRGAGVPTARVMMDADMAQQLRVSISGRTGGRNKFAAEDMAFSIRNQLQGMGVNTVVDINTSDQSSILSRNSVENQIRNFFNRGYISDNSSYA